MKFFGSDTRMMFFPSGKLLPVDWVEVFVKPALDYGVNTGGTRLLPALTKQYKPSQSESQQKFAQRSTPKFVECDGWPEYLTLLGLAQ